jgi:hypothetical protein
VIRAGVAWIGVFCWLLACAPALRAPAPGTAGIAGTLQLVPREGVPTQPTPGAYGDRRLRDVRFVDYSTPGASVVYLYLGSRPGGQAQLAVVEALAGLRLAPDVEVVGAGGAIAIANRTARAVNVSVPARDLVERIEAGGALPLRDLGPGLLEIFLLGTDRHASVWVTPGPWVRPDADGRFALTDLPPGRYLLRAWHPRLPAWSEEVQLEPGEIRSVEIQLGVGRGEGHHATH